uniref:ATP-dependent nuclease n=1 Tax=Streptomyces sp. NBC_01001 TaxID=2903713 RepID=UPI002F90FBA4
MTLFIGPNNSGKSALLRELAHHVTNPAVNYRALWIRQALPVHEGAAEDFLDWVSSRGHRSWEVNGEAHLRGGTNGGGSVTRENAGTWWTHAHYGELGSMLVTEQWTEGRLQVRAVSERWDHSEPAADPVQFLYEDPALLKAFSAYTKEAFGENIAVDWTVPGFQLRVGETGVPDVTPPSPELVAAYRRLPELSIQGDGFKAFVQILLHTVLRPTPVIVIDEPEAFLHPPQARLLGRILAQLPGQTQVFVATHSADFLAGVLDAKEARPLSLVRLDRSSHTPRARVLAPDAVAELLRTPLLRYSNIISGLFYDRVVLCESEGDCQFYAAAFDETRDGEAAHENTIFLHTSGKARLADTARRLRHCGIPTAIIADLDLLNDHGTVRRAVTALGSDVRDLTADIKMLNEHASGQRIIPTVDHFRKEVMTALNGPGSAPLTEQMTETISKLIKGSSGWGTLKKSGLSALSGDMYAAGERLLNATAGLGLFLVPCGELESWVRKIPSGNKQNWLAAVFDGGEYQRPSGELQEFCRRIRNFLNEPAQG